MAWASIFWKLMRIIISLIQNTTLRNPFPDKALFSVLGGDAGKPCSINTAIFQYHWIQPNTTKHFFHLIPYSLWKNKKSRWNNKPLRSGALLSWTIKKGIHENVSLKEYMTFLYLLSHSDWCYLSWLKVCNVNDKKQSLISKEDFCTVGSTEGPPSADLTFS